MRKKLIAALEIELVGGRRYPEEHIEAETMKDLLAAAQKRVAEILACGLVSEFPEDVKVEGEPYFIVTMPGQISRISLRGRHRKEDCPKRKE
jgi:hypothetical protein